MDPFEFLPSAVFDQILTHFNGNEILKLSEVSPFWDEEIGNSSVAMDKIKLKIHWRSDRSFFEESQSTVTSQRKYQHLEFLHQSSYLNSMTIVNEILKSSNRKWKSLKIKRISFMSSKEVEDMLQFVAPTIQSINIQDIFVTNYRDICISSLNFPKLRDLRIKHLNLSFIGGFSKCRKLEKFSVNSENPSVVNVIKQILEKNDLKSLEISSKLFKAVFKDIDVSKFKFKLKSFTATDLFKINEDVEKVRENFYNFIKAQMATLETLSVEEWLGVGVFKLMFFLPRLNALSFKGITNLNSDESLDLPVNKNIKSLSFRDYDPPVNVFKAVITCLPNLEKLEMNSMNQEMMDFLSANLKHLKSLKLRTMDATDFTSSDLFPKIDCIDIEYILSELEDVIISIPSKDRNRFVKLFLKSAYTILH